MGHMEKLYENHGARKQSAKTGNRMVIRFVAAIITIFAAAAMLTACSANSGTRNTKPAAIEESAATEPLEEARWINNVLKPDGDISEYTYNLTVLGSTILRQDIRSITFLDTLKDMPADNWDVSENRDGSVRAWVINEADLYIGADGGINARYCQNLFYGYSWVSAIYFNHCFHTDYATSMNSMFAFCSTLSVLDVSDFNTAEVEDMGSMFYGCYALTDLNIRGFSTSRVADMRNMFDRAPHLEAISGIEDFDTVNVTNYENFMKSGQQINGHPWEDLFPLPERLNRTVTGKEGLISLLEGYQSKYGDSYFESFYCNGDAAFLADLDGDGTDELVLNEWVDGDEDHDGYPDEVIIYCVYDYQDGAWQLCKESDAIGSVSFPGNSGQTHCVYKDGKAILAVREWRSPYGTSGGPGLDETATVTFYDNITQEIDIIEVKTVKVGYYDDDNTPIMTDVIRTYKINDIAASYDQFIRKLSEYEGISYILDEDDGYFSFDNWSGKMPSDLIRELRKS